MKLVLKGLHAIKCNPDGGTGFIYQGSSSLLSRILASSFVRQHLSPDDRWAGVQRVRAKGSRLDPIIGKPRPVRLIAGNPI